MAGDDEGMSRAEEERREALLLRQLGEYGSLDEPWVEEARERVEAGLAEGVCLVCLELLAPEEAVWNCKTCFESFHLPCIQGWAQQAIAQAQIAEAPPEEVLWYCPKCRQEYGKRECPRRYTCYCGRKVDPKPDPWLPPHSCGEFCGKALGACNHTCRLLCHSGPCPPCPAVISAACHCGRGPRQARRCGQGAWSCGRACDGLLDCGRHKCRANCHAGDCAPCAEASERQCRCGSRTELRPCSDGDWSCEQPCGKKLQPCLKHQCAEICHEGDCAHCVQTGENTCPCGKAVYEEGLGCRDELPTCGDTCDAVLDCGQHACIERCHRGPCPPCRETVAKRCRCGAREKIAPCAKEYLCDTKCRRQRPCGRHTCNRKCCDGECPPCSQLCGGRLGCGNHKCQSPCHTGKCYPCVNVTEVKCRCGKAVTRVPCGAERKTKPPRCRAQCSIPPDCQHPKREAHLCHFGDCPPCRQVCGKKQECGHTCPAKCHGAVLQDTAAPKAAPATPWEKHTPKMQLVSLPCPPCRFPVPVTCRGWHETTEFPCCEKREFSCGKACGRRLACGNHFCAQLCHQVPENKEKLGPNCDECSSMCTLPRPKGCSHTCPKSCHSPPCPTCPQMVKTTCECGVNTIFVPCTEWAVQTPQERRRSCGNQCPRELKCGHRCTKLCHSPDSPCSDPALCRKKVAVTCPCKRRSLKVECKRKESEKPECDDECEAAGKAKAEEEAARRLQAQTSTASTTTPDEEEGAGGARRRRKKKQRVEEETEPSVLQEKKVLIGVSAAIALSAFIYWLLTH